MYKLKRLGLCPPGSNVTDEVGEHVFVKNCRTAPVSYLAIVPGFPCLSKHAAPHLHAAHAHTHHWSAHTEHLHLERGTQIGKAREGGEEQANKNKSAVFELFEL